MKKHLLFLSLVVLTFTASFGQTISPFLAGQNAWLPTGYGGVTYNGGLDKLWPLVKKSKVQMVRIGGNGVEFNMPSGDEYLLLIDSIRAIGAEPLVQVSNGRGKYTAAQAAAIVNYVNNVKQRHIKYWIIGNEPNLVSTEHPVAVSVAGVADYMKTWSSAMKDVDSTILIVGPECSFYDSNYYNSLIAGSNDITGKDSKGRYYVDIVTFHSYPFNGTQSRSQVVSSVQNTLTTNVNNLIQLMNKANSLHGRTGDKALKWALTEFNIGYKNPVTNTVDGLGVHSFLNGQYWAEVFNLGMQKNAVSMVPWSVHESGGNRSALDLGYLDGAYTVAKPRSAFYHEMLIAENCKGTYLQATDNQSLITAFGSKYGDTTAVVLINKSETDNFDYTLQLSNNPIVNASTLKINLLSNINKEYKDKVFNQSTVVLLFNAQGDLIKKIVYSLQHAAQNLPPSYLKPGQSLTLVEFSSDKAQACIDQDQDELLFTSSIHGDYTSLNWNFGVGASPQTASGPGPVKVKYSSAGTKDVSLTLVGADTTIVRDKPAYIKAISCIRTPYVAAEIPGVIKAVNFDVGGEGVAYHDGDVANRGAASDPGVPRADESVDTERGAPGGNIGYSADGEWLKYTISVKKSGYFNIVARTASQSGGGSVRIWVNNVDKTGSVTVPKTSSWTSYQNVLIGTVYLEASQSTTIKVEIVKSGFNIDSFTFTEQQASSAVINRLFNISSGGDGLSDAVELLVTADHTDLRGIIIKDFEQNLTADAGGKYQFKDNALWKDLRKGTTIVLRKTSAGFTGYVEDADATDYKVDLLFENATYIANVSPAGSVFNLTNTDMVLLKAGSASGTDDAIHAFATNNGGNSPFYNAVTAPKLVSATILNSGAFQYPLNPEKSVADYNGSKVGNSSDANRNWGNGYGSNNIAYINDLRGPVTAVPAPTIVVNRIYNGSNDADGKLDAVELLVVKDRLDIRNLIVKDFETNTTADNGGKYSFKDVPLWQNLRAGTTIVLRKLTGPAGYVQDTDPSDFTLDILLENTDYITNLSGTGIFNITQYDMVLLKSGAATGVDNAIHAFATKGGGSGTSFYQTVSSYKLVSPDGTDAGGGSFHYPLNPQKELSDYNGTSAAISKSTAFNWGFGFGQNNTDYIQAIRDSVIAPPSQLEATSNANNRINLSWSDNTSAETGFEVLRSLDGISYVSIALTPANSIAYVDSCLKYQAKYYYKVRAKGEGIVSSYSAVAEATTGIPPTPILADLKGECSVTATAPVIEDACLGTITATTTDPLTYAAQGNYVINWSFNYGNGTISTATQKIIVKDITAPTVLTKNVSVTLVNGSASITAADLDNGSSDACGIASFSVNRTNFDCSSIGTNPVTLKVTDVNGNVDSAVAVVTVIGTTPTPVIAVTKTDQTFTKLDNTTIAIGYGAQNVTLTASGGTSYVWSPASGLSSATSASPVFTPTAAGRYTFTVSATNQYGCSASTSVTITVIDVRSGNNGDKVVVCTKSGTNTISIADNAVDTQLKNGATLGACNSATNTIASVVPSNAILTNSAAATNVLAVYPNPFENQTLVNFTLIEDESKITLDLYNVSGVKAQNIYVGSAKGGQTYSFAVHTNLNPGVYFFRLTGSKVVLNTKVLKL